MRFRVFATASILACPMAFAPTARAEVILDPIGVSASVGAQIGTINNVINQSGLSSPYISGVTDFASYTASTPTSNGGNSSVYISSGPSAPINVDFNLGGSYDIDSFALWALEPSSMRSIIKGFTLLASDDSSFTTTTTLGTFTATVPTAGAVPAQDFDFTATTTSYVRMEITSTYGTITGAGAGFNEGAFAEVSGVIPEPSSLVLTCLAGAIGSAYAWRRRQRAATA